VIESFFIGPHAENTDFIEDVWRDLLRGTLQHRRETFSADGQIDLPRPDADQQARLRREITDFFAILQREVPTFSNRYLGHMVSDVSIPALAGNIAVLFSNPNLASKEVATAGIFIETHAINALADMIGFEPGPARGHFTSGGTVANFEAFWRARYRMDHWLSLGAYLCETGRADDLFTLAHQGWESFDATVAAHGITLQELRQRSYVVRGPWDIARYYHHTLQRDFPEPVILVPGNKHYSWPKSANVFGLSENAIWLTELDRYGRVSPQSLARNIDKARELGRTIMMNVSVAGTTELGTVDPVAEVCDLLDEYREREGLHIWHHVDAAYGGYFCSTFRDGRSELAPATVDSLHAIRRVDSVTLDPHKLGYVPYSCGAFLVRDPRSYAVSSISAPYLVEDKAVEYPTWSTTLEGSRSATGAGAVWLSSRVLPLDATGHGELLNHSLRAKLRFVERLQDSFDDIHFTPGSDSNIICFVLAAAGSPLSAVNRTTAGIVDQFVHSPNFAVTRTALGMGSYPRLIEATVGEWDGELDDDHLLVIRMVIMNPYLHDAQANEKLMGRFIEELSAFRTSAAG
jgi:glutamate/tyrosine decarboxylase-like PLP-dependent enzyme